MSVRPRTDYSLPLASHNDDCCITAHVRRLKVTDGFVSLVGLYWWSFMQENLPHFVNYSPNIIMVLLYDNLSDICCYVDIVIWYDYCVNDVQYETVMLFMTLCSSAVRYMLGLYSSTACRPGLVSCLVLLGNRQTSWWSIKPIYCFKHVCSEQIRRPSSPTPVCMLSLFCRNAPELAVEI